MIGSEGVWELPIPYCCVLLVWVFSQAMWTNSLILHDNGGEEQRRGGEKDCDLEICVDLLAVDGASYLVVLSVCLLVVEI